MLNKTPVSYPLPQVSEIIMEEGVERFYEPEVVDICIEIEFARYDSAITHMKLQWLMPNEQDLQRSSQATSQHR